MSVYFMPQLKFPEYFLLIRTLVGMVCWAGRHTPYEFWWLHFHDTDRLRLELVHMALFFCPLKFFMIRAVLAEKQ